MTTRFRFAIAFLAVLFLPESTHAQKSREKPEKKTDLEIAREHLDSTRGDRDEAYNALEAMIFDLEDDYLELTTGVKAATYRHRLALAMHDSMPTALSQMDAQTQEGRPLLRGFRRAILSEAFEPPVRVATSLDPRLCSWVARGTASELSRLNTSLDTMTTDELLRTVNDLFPPGLSWYRFWNQEFHQDLTETAAYSRAVLGYEEAGLELNRLLHPERYGPRGEKAPPGMVIVPGGTYELGPDNGWERPARKVNIKPFYLDRREVTSGEYSLFVNASATSRRAGLLPRGWKLNKEGLTNPDSDERGLPVAYVSWMQAVEYAKWADKRLPTEDEWEAAAGGIEGLAYPWGNQYQTDMANGGGDGETLLPVESYPYSRSPTGCFDMAGNVWEWTATLEDGTDIKTLPEGMVNVVIRGGSFQSRRDELSTRYRWTAPGHGTFSSPRYTRPIGFRCAKNP